MLRVQSAVCPSIGLPKGLGIEDVGDGYVLGTRRSQLEIEHGQMYELIKPGR